MKKEKKKPEVEETEKVTEEEKPAEETTEKEEKKGRPGKKTDAFLFFMVRAWYDGKI